MTSHLTRAGLSPRAMTLEGLRAAARRAQQWGTRPAALAGLSDPLAAWVFDELAELVAAHPPKTDDDPLIGRGGRLSR